MQKKKYIAVFISILCFCTHITFANTSPYLVKPTGKYGVGYQDFHWINTKLCPDPFYNGKNQSDFSQNNRKYCREVMVRIYYPAVIPLGRYADYYRPLITKWQTDFATIDIPQQLMESLSAIHSYSFQDIPIYPSSKQFPVILFNPGLADVAEDYENFILNLVSHGYIVIAINNTFVGGPIQFPNGHIVDAIANADEKQISLAVINDMRFVYQKIRALHNTSPIFSLMNLDQMGVFGHSVGAYMTVQLIHKNPTWFKAVVAMDAPGLPASEDMFQGFAIPFIHMHAADWRTVYSNAGSFNLTKKEYFVLLTPDSNVINYSRHNNFSNLATLQYQPAMQWFSQYEEKQGTPWVLDVGTVDGYQATGIVNDYLLSFFNHYLKNFPSPMFENCLPIAGTLMTCGSGKA
jgi:pimeloyl-ACP methyl ester carboxylesterase